MATFSKIILSGSTSGKQISIQSTGPTGNLGTTIHTAGAGTILDEIWLYAVNYSATSTPITLQWGTITATKETTLQLLPNSTGLLGLTPIVAGLILGNSLVLSAFSSAASRIAVYGYVNRITV